MNWDAFTPWSALAGGVLIGAATGIALLLNGKIAGISGVVARVFRPAPGDAAWRVWFIVGMVATGALAFAFVPRVGQGFQASGGPLLFAVAGLLVGVGTRVGGGCTSGHGVCGISRGSTRGVAGTLIFMAAAMLTVYVQRHLLGASS